MGSWEKNYKGMVNVEEEMEDVNEETLVGDINIENLNKNAAVLCVHGVSGRISVRNKVNSKIYSGLIATGIQISLVNASVIKEFEKLNWQIPKKKY